MNQITIYVDGLCEPVNPGGHACYAWSAQDDTGAEIAAAHGHLVSGPLATNNVAEFGAVIWALRHAQAEGWTGVQIRSDSQLVINQLNGMWQCNADGLVKYLNAARRLMAETGATIAWLPREQNQRADGLSRLAYKKHTGKDARISQRRSVRRRCTRTTGSEVCRAAGAVKGRAGLRGAARPAPFTQPS
jgi:ribonuclease HI